MDIDEIRRQNILILEREAGSVKAMHEAVKMSYAQYVNLRDGAKDARSGKPRGMRKETAWRFEDAGNKDRGWLDQPHGEARNEPPPRKATPLTPRQQALVDLFDGLTEGQQDEVIRRLQSQKQSNDAIMDELMKKRQRA
jgi:hypothetical protein